MSDWSAAPAYDDDGNMVEAFLNGQYRLLTYNGENRLIIVEPEAAPVSGDKKIEYAYDYRGRRVSKKVSVHDGSAYNLDSHEVFVYDSWNMVAVLDAGNSYALAKTYSWGSDLSGSMQGAGGVGGLLACEEKSGTHADTYSFTYDANGNVAQVVDSLGTIDAHYEYTPFGQVAASAGAYKDANLYKFSTKYEDTETATLYYDYRSYDPNLGRWLNRDPIAENGGLNLYAFVSNDGLDLIDILGLCGEDQCLDEGTAYLEYAQEFEDTVEKNASKRILPPSKSSELHTADTVGAAETMKQIASGSKLDAIGLAVDKGKDAYDQFDKTLSQHWLAPVAEKAKQARDDLVGCLESKEDSCLYDRANGMLFSGDAQINAAVNKEDRKDTVFDNIGNVLQSIINTATR